MGIKDKFKSLLNVSEEEYYDDIDIDEDEVDSADYNRGSDRGGFSFNRSHNDSGDNKIVDMRSSVPAPNSPKAKIVFNKLDRYEDVATVADGINEKKIVVLNLETCPNDVSVRIIDFLSGVTYANNAEMKRIAGRVYLITPHNMPLTGDLLDGIDHAY